MRKIPFNELHQSDQDLIKKRMKRMFVYNVWVEENTHIDEDSGIELTSGFYKVHAKMRPWASIMVILFLPLISIVGAVKVGVATFVEDMSSITSIPTPFEVFSYRMRGNSDNSLEEAQNEL